MKKNYVFFVLCIFLTGNTLIGQTASIVTKKAPIRIETPKNWNKNKSKHDSALYNAPPNCVITDFTLNVTKRNGPVQHSVDFVQGGSRFISTQEMNDAFSSADNLATTLKIKGTDYLDLKANLDSKYTEYEKIQNTIEASHATIQHKATVNGNGRFNGRSWYEGDVTVKLLCFEGYMKSKAKLDAELKEYVQQYADSISKIKENSNTNGNNSTDTGNTYTQKPAYNIWLYIGGGLIIILLIILLLRRKK